jgi:putative ABC transport system permease protein
MRTPLAWKNLTSSWNKCALASAGVGFAVVLMFMQIGFKNALIDNNVQVFALFDTEVANMAVISRARYSLASELRFPRHLLDKLSGYASVTSTGSVNLERASSQIKVHGFSARPIRVMALDSAAVNFLATAELKQKFAEADALDGCLVDTQSKPFYGFADDLEQLKQQQIELNGIALPAIDFFRLGTDFSNDGTILMSQRVHAKYFPWRSRTRKPEDQIDIGLINVQSGENQTLQVIAQTLQAAAENQAIVEPTESLIEREKQFWSEVTPIGKIFTIGTLMGLVVGAIICYQIQFTDISDHMSELATLKAMGYSSGYFWSLVLSQSFYLACLGFLPGIIVSFLLYQVLAEYSGLIMMMTWGRIVSVGTDFGDVCH